MLSITRILCRPFATKSQNTEVVKNLASLIETLRPYAEKSLPWPSEPMKQVVRNYKLLNSEKDQLEFKIRLQKLIDESRQLECLSVTALQIRELQDSLK